MLKINFDEIKSILCVGAHADDIEIGCGGTILKLLAENNSIEVHWIVLSATDERAEEAVRSAESFLREAQDRHILVKNFRDTFFPYCGTEIKEFFNDFSREISPDLIFTHWLEDRHQDHRFVSELTWNTFRDHLVLEYEIPKYEGDLGKPNIFLPLSESICQRKVETTVRAFRSQQSKKWFTPDAFWSLLRIRGIESNSPSKFAEALHCRKLIL
jgi:LmbE family N-acetylglucosaminyl deacetylase